MQQESTFGFAYDDVNKNIWEWLHKCWSNKGFSFCLECVDGTYYAINIANFFVHSYSMSNKYSVFLEKWIPIFCFPFTPCFDIFIFTIIFFVWAMFWRWKKLKYFTLHLCMYFMLHTLNFPCLCGLIAHFEVGKQRATKNTSKMISSQSIHYIFEPQTHNACIFVYIIKIRRTHPDINFYPKCSVV